MPDSVEVIKVIEQFGRSRVELLSVGVVVGAVDIGHARKARDSRFRVSVLHMSI